MPRPNSPAMIRGRISRSATRESSATSVIAGWQQEQSSRFRVVLPSGTVDALVALDWMGPAHARAGSDVFGLMAAAGAWSSDHGPSPVQYLCGFSGSNTSPARPRGRSC